MPKVVLYFEYLENTNNIYAVNMFPLHTRSKNKRKRDVTTNDSLCIKNYKKVYYIYWCWEYAETSFYKIALSKTIRFKGIVNNFPARDKIYFSILVWLRIRGLRANVVVSKQQANGIFIQTETKLFHVYYLTGGRIIFR